RYGFSLFTRPTSRIWATSPFNQRQRRGRIAEVSHQPTLPRMDGSRYRPTICIWNATMAKRSFLLAARKRKRSRRGEGYVGKLRANFLGTAFTVICRRRELTAAKSPEASRRELAGITYETNVLGFRGPRKMTVVLPAMLEAEEGDCVRVDIRPNSEEEGLRPSPMCSTFTVGSLKRRLKIFQIVRDNDVDQIVMQFGRISDDLFTMDFAYPLCPLQAFGIALSSFDSKLACE
uniref:Tub domain-containing protein n=1 Tax=Macrostomum lignano TaxID=282301 RepID=A0A1I8FAS0_9PLAT